MPDREAREGEGKSQAARRKMRLGSKDKYQKKERKEKSEREPGGQRRENDEFGSEAR